MPLYVFQTSGNPFVRILIGLVSFAVLVGLGFLMLPVVLAVIAAVMVMGLVAWGWAWWKARQAGGTTDWYAASRQASEQGAREDVRETRTETTVLSIKTSDNKKWKMNDVEDIEERK
jgi:hypothetical protein